MKPCPPDKLLPEIRVVIARSRQLRAAAGAARGRSVHLREKSVQLLEKAHHVAPRPDERSFHDPINRVRGEYVEIPGLSLTSAQARVLLQLKESLCTAVLDRLVQDGFLRRTPRGVYVLCR